jgi:hypothetical protein
LIPPPLKDARPGKTGRAPFYAGLPRRAFQKKLHAADRELRVGQKTRPRPGVKLLHGLLDLGRELGRSLAEPVPLVHRHGREPVVIEVRQRRLEELPEIEVVEHVGVQIDRVVQPVFLAGAFLEFKVGVAGSLIVETAVFHGFVSSCAGGISIMVPIIPFFALGARPEQQIIFKLRGDPAGIQQPGEIGADGAADQRVLLKAHAQIVRLKELLQKLLKAQRLPAERGDPLGDLVHLVDVLLRERGDLLRGGGVRGNELPRGQVFHGLQRIEVGGDVVDEPDLIFFERLGAGQAVGQIDDVIGVPVAHHVEEVARQRQDLEPVRQAAGRERLRVALLRQQEFVPQRLRREAAVEKARLQDRMPGEAALDAGRIDFAAGLFLQIRISADVVGVGVRIVDRSQMPAVRVQKLARPAARVLVAAAVDQADVRFVQPDKADLGGTLNIIAVFSHLRQLKHRVLPLIPQYRHRRLRAA